MARFAPSCETCSKAVAVKAAVSLVDVTALPGKPSPAGQATGHRLRWRARSRNRAPVGNWATDRWLSILSGHSVRAMSQKRHSLRLGTFQGTFQGGDDTHKILKGPDELEVHGFGRDVNFRAIIDEVAGGSCPCVREKAGEEGEEIEPVTPGFHFHRQLFRLRAEPRACGESAPPLPAEGWVPQRWPPGP